MRNVLLGLSSLVVVVVVVVVVVAAAEAAAAVVVRSFVKDFALALARETHCPGMIRV